MNWIDCTCDNELLLGMRAALDALTLANDGNLEARAEVDVEVKKRDAGRAGPVLGLVMRVNAGKRGGG